MAESTIGPPILSPLDQSKQTLESNWLARARATPLLTSTLSNFIREHGGSDWFVSMDSAIKPIEPGQAQILVKVYIFLREFIPQGLAGKWAHICMKDVMDSLLPYATQRSISRHGVEKHAGSWLSNLEKWMSMGRSWREALKNAKNRGPKYEANSSILAHLGKAPVLRPPASMLALLALVYPDLKCHNMIGRLQIGWMMERREALNVQEGFWKGINAENVNAVFSIEISPLNAEVEFLMDYDQLFVNQFVNCRNDIRNIVCEHTVEHTYEESAYSNSDITFPDNFDIREHLNPIKTTSEAELKRWLVGLIVDSGDNTATLPLVCHEYAACKKANDILTQRVRKMNERAVNILKNVSKRQADYVYSVLRFNGISDHTDDVMELDRLHTQMVIQSFEGTRPQQPADSNCLWDDIAVQTLKLTNWQRRESIQLGVKLSTILTDWQLVKMDRMMDFLVGTASAGEQGYITSHCPAPELINQTAYEATLLRAVVYYFGLCENNSDGLPKDEHCLDLTVEEFPTLIPDHIPIALEHFHVQVYYRPMPDPD
ncbi:hypothetical protein Daesc_009837 [Daldinia eschscholtzii]|uniref:Uncharacterized protein n=1 Tax=Daldinia eschscholtzii TaxID=292717 RepID=A0AAX6M6P5_9PEZI